MIKFIIGGAVGFGIAYVIFQRPQDRILASAQRMIDQASQRIQNPPTSIPQIPGGTMQGFGYSRY